MSGNGEQLRVTVPLAASVGADKLIPGSPGIEVGGGRLISRPGGCGGLLERLGM